ncbi:PREDICTED: WAP four-disulfide core domain protein 18 [Myotis brandtii]|uniref:WAP four-disulfide core domain protein 18 n=1 Tax=Myotis brandtii TaxID=109478 RepID=UPI0003BB90C4|nr:PREDICTED: WAP four-disulfide core domain protein 18 [Myotis brandtii]
MKTCTVFVLVAFITVGMEMACGDPLTPLVQEQQRPGVCPKVSEDFVGHCSVGCIGDASCPKRMKCCNHGCGRVCKIALPAKGGLGGPVKDGQGVY